MAKRTLISRWRILSRRTRIAIGGVLGTGALLLVCAIALELAIRFVPFDPSTLATSEQSTVILDKDGRMLRPFLANDDRWRVPADLTQIAPALVQATLAAEDWRFYSHRGVDYLSAFRAVWSNATSGRIVSGASTITMQAVALDRGREPRTFGRKLLQAFHALQLERQWDKKRILEFYFTHAPYGGNICGAETASRRYFNKPSSELTVSEAALLAGLPQSPSRYRPDRNPGEAIKRRNAVLNRMRDREILAAPECARLIAQRPVIGAYDTAVKAPHFADLLRTMYPRRVIVNSTLDSDIQSRAEGLLSRQVASLAPQSITNGAAVVIENRNGKVRALVGSADYRNKSNDGEVNGALGLRSPGSTLKPFLYALALDQGKISPRTTLYDVPRQFAGYEPRNFSGQFMGLVKADQALAWSLNLPAIQVLQETGVPSALRLLKDIGLGTIKDAPGQYGLSLAIGTCGVRLLDLTNSYAALARGGKFMPARFLEDGVESAETSAPRQFLSPGSCSLVLRALSDPALRPPEDVLPGLVGMTEIAWKTGTSNGYKDAWTIAVGPRYTVGVWVGNFDGKPGQNLVGVKAAAPVALALISQIHKASEESDWLKPHRGRFSEAVVCGLTGMACGPDCATTATALLPADNARRLLACSIHRKVSVDTAIGETLCTRCQPGRAWSERVFEYWPAPVAAWLKNHQPNRTLPPEHLAECVTVNREAAPVIASPADNSTFIIMKEMPLSFQKVAFQATSPNPGTRLFWFLDGKLVSSATASEIVFCEPSAGWHTVRCVDEKGRHQTARFVIKSDG